MAGGPEKGALEMDVSESGADGLSGASSTSSTRTSLNSQDASIGGSSSITMGSTCNGDKPTDQIT